MAITEVVKDVTYVREESLGICGDEVSLIVKTNTVVAEAAEG